MGSTLSRLPPGAGTLSDRLPLLALDEQTPCLHGGGAADVVAAIEPLAAERHRQGELLGADLVNLDGGGSGLHGVKTISSTLHDRTPGVSGDAARFMALR